MDDLISRQAAVDCVYGSSPNRIKGRIAELPSAQPERKTGHWVKAERRGCVAYSEAYAECDHCHKVIFDAWNFDYCPRCGATMD